MQVGLGRIYPVVFVAVSLTAVQDLFYIKPAADKILVFEAMVLSNVGGVADAGDAQEELLRFEIIYLPSTVTVGSGGTAPTVKPVGVNDAAAGFTARVNDTTVATTSGTSETRHADGINIRIPQPWVPPPEHRLIAQNPGAMVVRLNTAPADAVLVSGTLYVREMP